MPNLLVKGVDGAYIPLQFEGNISLDEIQERIQADFDIPKEHQEITVFDRNKDVLNLLGMLTDSEVEPSTPIDRFDPRTIYQVGGGKRSARELEDGKEERVKECREKLLAFKHKVEGAGVAGHSVAHLLTDFGNILNAGKPDQMFSDCLTQLKIEKTKGLLKSMGGLNSNRPEKKFNVVAKFIFTEHLASLREASSQVSEAFAVVQSATELILTSQFADEAGNINWGSFTKCLTDKIDPKTNDNSAREDETSDYEMGDAGEGGGGGGGDGKDKSRGRGRPKKASTTG